MESKEKLTSLEVEAGEATAVLPSLPIVCKQSLCGLLLLFLELGLELLAALLRYVLILDIDGSGIYLGGVNLVIRHCV